MCHAVAMRIGILGGTGPAGSGLAARLASGPTRAFAGAKRLIHESLQSTFETHLALESDLIVSGGSTHDAAEGMRAFAEKRPPEFTGN